MHVQEAKSPIKKSCHAALHRGNSGIKGLITTIPTPVTNLLLTICEAIKIKSRT
jgi:hypothetical protein